MSRLATLSSRDSYGASLAREFTRRAEELGAEVIIQEWYEPGTTDYRGQFSRIRDAGMALKVPDLFRAGIDSLLLGGIPVKLPPLPADPDSLDNLPVETLDGLLVGAASYEDVLLIAPQAASSLIRARLLGGDGWNYDRVAVDGGSYVDGAVFVARYHDQSPLESVQDFVNQFRARYGRDQDIVAALGHDAMLAIITAIERGGTTRLLLTQKLQALSDVPAATGRITFRPGDRQNAWMNLLAIQHGRVVSLPDGQGAAAAP